MPETPADAGAQPVIQTAGLTKRYGSTLAAAGAAGPLLARRDLVTGS